MSVWRWVVLVVTMLITGCASLPEQYERSDSFALQDTASTALGQAGREPLQDHPGQSAFRPLPGGVDALVARMVLAEAAERSLDVQYYIWHDDLTGRLFAHALLRAADRGVRVRILVDDVGTKANDEVLLSLDAHPQIEVRLFNPVASRTFRGLGMLSDFSRTNRRMHNKSFVADNQRAVLGGRNIGDEYFEAHGEVAFGDLDVLTLGPVVAEVSEAFDLFWNAPMSIPIGALTGRLGQAASLDVLREQLAAFAEAQADSAYARQARSTAARGLATGTDGMFWGRGHVVVDDPAKVTRPPEDTEGHLLPQLARIGVQLRSELLIVSPYFVPGDAGVAALTALVQKGVRVTVLTNSLAATDEPLVHTGYARYRPQLLAYGVELYELSPERTRRSMRLGVFGSSFGRLHAKTAVVDRRTVFIGSMNLDPRSDTQNTELGIFVDSPQLARELLRIVHISKLQSAYRVRLDDQGRLQWLSMDEDKEVVLTEEPETSPWLRLHNLLVSPFVPEQLL